MPAGRVAALLLLPPILAAIPFAQATLSSSEVNIVEVRRPEEKSIHLRAVVYSGSAEDPNGKEGLAFFTAHLLASAMAEQPGAAVARIDVAVGKDMIAFSAEAPPEALDGLLDLFAAVLLKPSFDPTRAQDQRARQIQHIEEMTRDGDALAREAFDALVYRGHPYAHPAAGRLSSVAGLGAEDAAAFHRDHFRKGNVAIGVAGDLPAGLAARLRTDFSALPDGAPGRALRPFSFLPRPRAVIVQHEEGERAPLMIGHLLTVARAHPDYFALRVAQAHLGGSGSARLDAALRRARGISETVVVEIEQADAAGGLRGSAGRRLLRREQALAIAAVPSVANTAFTIRLLLRELEELGRAGIAGERLEEVKAAARERRLFDPGSASAELEYRMEEPLARTPGLAGRFAASLDAVSAESLRAALARALLPRGVAIVAVIPRAEDLIEAMMVPQPSVKYPSGVNAAALLEEDRAIWGHTGGLTRHDIEVVKPSEIFH